MVSRRKLTLLSVAAAVLLAAVLLGSVWISYFTGKNADFSLLPPLPLPSSLGAPVSGPASGGLNYQPLTVEAENVQRVLASVERPKEYRQTIECIVYWSDGEWSVEHRWSQRGALTRIETLQGGSLPQNRVIAPGHVYIWTGDVLPSYEVLPEDTDAESLAGVPTWEAIMTLPVENILHAEYVYLPGERCLYIKTNEAVYNGEYTLSLETGVLVSAIFYEADGTLAYRYTFDKPVLGDPGDSFFILPDGTRIKEGEEAEN